jgi:hypothetical protein
MKHKILGHKFNAIKITLFCMAIVILTEVYSKILVVLSLRDLRTQLTSYAILILYLVFFRVFKHKFWMISWLLLIISKIFEIIVGKYFASEMTVTISIVIIILLLISLSFLIIFWSKEDYSDYFWLK